MPCICIYFGIVAIHLYVHLFLWNAMLFSYGFHWPVDLGYSDPRFNDRYYQMIDRSYQMIDRSSPVIEMSYQILLLLFTGWGKKLQY